MRLILDSHEFGENYTIGSLFLNGTKLCWTLEDAVREKPGVPVSQWKVQNETAIPGGIYKVVVDYSNRFKRDLPRLLDVPGFTGIRIHPGNSSHNTEGCILLGETWDGGDWIGNSRPAFNRVFALIKAAFGSGEEVTIEVVR